MDTSKLKIAREHLSPVAAVPDRVALDADLGGVGLDWARRPDALAGAGVQAWDHLAGTFAEQATRFREADRHAVIAYCSAIEQATAAGDALREHGVLVEGRSEADRGRPVRSPAWAMWRDASVQVRQWSAELGLSPSSRARMKLPDDITDPIDNPFTPEGA